MRFRVRASSSTIGGTVRIPPSKSHTIRAVYCASYAAGESLIRGPLRSADTASAVEVCRRLGAEISEREEAFLVKGFGGRPSPASGTVDVGNSGTSLRIGMGVAALAPGETVFTGDEQIRRRPLGPLGDALNDLGARVDFLLGNGCAPVRVRGVMEGGATSIEAVTSQYLTSLLMNCPLAPRDTEIAVPLLNERPYIDMTLWWLRKRSVAVEYDEGYTRFFLEGGQAYSPFEEDIPADFSSATFFIVLAAVSGGEIAFPGLDLDDPQGDKEVLRVVEAMGARVERDESGVRVRGGELRGMEVDMNAIPDALPALAVAGCFARGETRLVNAPQARLKETDRIRVMREELERMGARVEELEHGLVVRESALHGAWVHGRGDHRVVMALAVAGLNAPGETVVETAEAVDVTFPGFAGCVAACGGWIAVDEEEGEGGAEY